MPGAADPRGAGGSSTPEKAAKLSAEVADNARALARKIAEKPGDLGYWAGAQIARAYYDRSPDKQQAVKTLLTSADAKGLLAASGGTRLTSRTT